MYPRLKLARNLLTEDGVIFISIDDYEAAHLVQIGNEIFGSDNALTSDCSGPFVWPKSGATAGHAVRNHEYIYAWARNKKKLPFFKLSSYGDDSQIQDRALKKISKSNPPSTVTLKKGMRFEGEDGEFSGIIGKSETMEIHGTMKFRGGRLIDDVSVTAGWAMKEQLESWMSGNETFDSKGQRVIEFFFNKSGLLRYIKERGTFHPRTLLDRESVGSTKTASAEIQSITGMANPFDYAKPTDLISYFISFCTSNEDIILDFFAGSGSTGHAVIKQSIKDGESRRFFVFNYRNLFHYIRISETSDLKILRITQGLGFAKLLNRRTLIQVSWLMNRMASEHTNSLTPTSLNGRPTQVCPRTNWLTFSLVLLNQLMMMPVPKHC